MILFFKEVALTTVKDFQIHYAAKIQKAVSSFEVNI